MTAQPTAEVHGAATISASDSAAEVARWSAGTLCSLLASAAALVAWRRLAGALDSPLAPAALLAVGLVVTATACGVRRLWQRLSAEAAGRIAPRSLLLSAAVLVMGLSLSLPGTSVGGLLAFWFLVVGEEVWAWLPLVRQFSHVPSSAIATPPVEQSPPVVPDAPPSLPAEADDIVPPQEVLQQLTRSQTADGSEFLAGWLRMAFAAGQRTGSLHVAFCPPFAKTPELTVEQLDGPEARIKTAQLLPYGVRLDLKLAATPDAPGSVLLQFSARSEGSSADSEAPCRHHLPSSDNSM